ncbi:MAG: diguanylate cyclase [Planctomycetes bacterium]|nr:diguanylate cyclase [Planctomycetota bacterium]
MRRKSRLLVIGPSALRQIVARALPRHEISVAEDALGGVWEMGKRTYDEVLLSLSVGKNALRAVRSLREVAPAARIVVTCPPPDEPHACQALHEGADDYILEPMTREDLEHAFKLPTQARISAGPAPGPTMHEIVLLADVLKNIGDGPQPTLDRFASLLQEAFGAESVVVQIDDLLAAIGDASAAVLDEAIRRHNRTVGYVSLGKPAHGAYAASTAARLADYANLIETAVTQARERERWQQLAWTDDLCGLRNRRYFEQVLDDLIVRAADQRLRVTVLLFDIDGFKSYNDSYGHDTGDALLREIAALLKRCSRESDVVTRYGGDEFAVIFWDAEKPRVPGSRHPTEPVVLAERFREATRLHEFKCLGENAPGRVTISGGLASFPWNGATREELLRAADDALRAAKRTGKNQIVLAESASVSETLEDTAD